MFTDEMVSVGAVWEGSGLADRAPDLGGRQAADLD